VSPAWGPRRSLEARPVPPEAPARRPARRAATDPGSRHSDGVPTAPVGPAPPSRLCAVLPSGSALEAPQTLAKKEDLQGVPGVRSSTSGRSNRQVPGYALRFPQILPTKRQRWSQKRLQGFCPVSGVEPLWDPSLSSKKRFLVAGHRHMG
jgi:hypothetical protein